MFIRIIHKNKENDNYIIHIVTNLKNYLKFSSVRGFFCENAINFTGFYLYDIENSVKYNF